MKNISEFVSEIKKSNSYILSFFIITLFVGLLGGVFGSFAYLDYKGIGNFSDSKTFSNLSVKEDSAVINVAKNAGPSVVSITGVQERYDFFGNIREAKSSGTGFIVSSDGLIITNKHVVSDQNAKYSVFTSDGKEYSAQVRAKDPNNDIAIIKIDAKNLSVLTLGDSENIQVGQRVVAIGNALGQYQNSVTTGVISAIGRAIEAGDSSGSTESLENVIQTDAAINPGNSGGPLVNLAGQVIGINTAIDQEGQSIGFAIPINLAKSALQSYISKGRIVRPMLGVRYIPITKEFASRNNLTVTEGAFIYGGESSAVISGSPAALAGIKENDIITKINNDSINANNSLSVLLSKYQPGDKVRVTYIRDREEITKEVILSETK